MLEQIKSFYQNFIRLSDENWMLLSSKLKVVNLKKGEKLHDVGEVCNYVTFVNKGLLRAYHVVDGKEFIETFFIENEYLSDYCSFLTRSPGLLIVECLEDCELVLLDYDSVQELYESVDEFQKFGRLMAEYLFTMVSMRSNSLLFESPEQRYLNFQKENADLLQRVPQYMIASYLGVTPEALSRIRKRIVSN
jgi:CRP-like cAMP-binding protein